MKKKGFTLIELLAVIVILAIIALIATPLVLKYIEKAREGANKASVQSILKASENYYMASKLNEETEYPKTISFPDENNILGLKGKQPDKGLVQIYGDGSIYLNAVFGEKVYSKYPNETEVSENSMVIGDYRLWETDENLIVGYNENYQEEETLSKLNDYVKYYMIINYYVSGSNLIDKTKTLIENINIKEKDLSLNRSNLPSELNEELDKAIEIYKSIEPGSMTEEQFLGDALSRESDLPYIVDLYPKTNSEEATKTSKAYSLIKNSYTIDDKLVIPNYVREEDGSLTQILGISKDAFYRDEYIDGVRTIYCAISNKIEENILIPTSKYVIISEGIMAIDSMTFIGCQLSSVALPSTLTTIGSYSFSLNQLKTITFYDSLEEIGELAFYSSGLKGNIIIPKSVKKIGEDAFRGVEVDCDTTTTPDDYQNCINISNNITKVTFAENSKIETIEEGAFADNSITNITIPGSIKSIGANAFNCSMLTSATIERTQGSDLTVDSTAFGTITPTYN